MGELRTYTVESFITDLRYELRDTVTVYKYTANELLSYINKCAEMVHIMLIDKESELVRSGSGTITTSAGTQSYDLDSNSMGDLWAPHRVWVDEKEPMTICEEWELYDGINAEERSETGHRTEPQKYCIIADYIWFKEVPDDAYTVRLKYYPGYALLASDTQMPYRNLFNQSILEAVKIVAKNRDEIDVQIDAILKTHFENEIKKVLRRRTVKKIYFRPGLKSHKTGFNFSRTR